MLNPVCSETETEALISSGQATLLYFSTSACNVCKALKPKLEDLLERDFPRIHPFFVDTEKFPMTAARYRIFAVPTLLVFFEGQETIRKSRFIHPEELRLEIQRFYDMLFL